MPSRQATAAQPSCLHSRVCCRHATTAPANWPAQVRTCGGCVNADFDPRGPLLMPRSVVFNGTSYKGTVSASILAVNELQVYNEVLNVGACTGWIGVRSTPEWIHGQLAKEPLCTIHVQPVTTSHCTPHPCLPKPPPSGVSLSASGHRVCDHIPWS